MIDASYRFITSAYTRRPSQRRRHLRRPLDLTKTLCGSEISYELAPADLGAHADLAECSVCTAAGRRGRPHSSSGVFAHPAIPTAPAVDNSTFHPTSTELQPAWH